MKLLMYLIQVFAILQIVLFENVKCVNLHYETGDIVFIIEQSIGERQQQLEDKLRREFNKKIKTIMEEQLREKQKVKHLEETLKQHQREISRLKQSEEFNRQELKALKQNVKDLTMKCQQINNDHSVSKKCSPTFHGIVSSNDSSLGQKVGYSGIRPATIAVEESREARLLLGTVQPDEIPVAFYAFMSTQEIIGPHHTLIYDNVETNIGNGYNSHTGIFVAPQSGIYLFAYTTHVELSSYVSIEILVNGVIRGVEYVQNPGHPAVYTGSTGIAVLFLNQGDDCFIRTHSTYISHGTIQSDMHMRTTFSGVKI